MAEPFRVKRRIFVGATLALIVTGVWGLWSHYGLSNTSESGAMGKKPFVQLAGGGQATPDQVLRERADYFDPAPLFIPTARNFGQSGLPPRLVKQPGQVFANFEAKLNFAEGGLANYGTENLGAAENVVEILARASEVPFAGFGEEAPRPVALEQRNAFVQIKRMTDGELREINLTGITLPRADFAPLEFVVAIGASGITGGPLLAAGSGRDEIDLFFRDYLAKTLRIGSVLAPGRYRITIGP
ncbi:MAG: hypothetical protein Q8M02_09515 [Candidatus Didemnitutus sp.]|nr:hypothetical protein [Candidatus Didemnitutus sp.]